MEPRFTLSRKWPIHRLPTKPGFYTMHPHTRKSPIALDHGEEFRPAGFAGLLPLFVILYGGSLTSRGPFFILSFA